MVVNAIFPNGIPLFVDHRDLLDDVNASHINTIQRELTSVAEVLGENPHIYGDASSATDYIYADPGGDGILNADMLGQAPFSAQLNQVNYGTVSNRLDDIQKGFQFHVFSLVGGGLVVPPTTNINLSNPLIGIQMPNQGYDPYGLYNGFGFTIKKTGWYYVQGQVLLNLEGTQAERDGAYAAAVNINGYNLNAYDRERLADSAAGRNPGSVVLQPATNGILTAGSTIHLRVGHDSAVNHTVTRAYLNGFLVREI